MSEPVKSKSWKWTKEAVLADARKYASKSEWRKNSGAYAMAIRQGWLEEACAHMTALWSAKWTKETVILDALKYMTRSEWETRSNGAWSSARRNGWYVEATQHMAMQIKKWTKESVIADAQKYQTRGEWSAKSKSYSIARNNNWVEEATAHMFTTMSFGELVIFTDLLEHDIKFTHQMKFEDLRSINKLPFDFYLTDLNLIVEYHGIQHERGWQGNEEDAKGIKQRDQIKYDYAITKGISYIAISKTDRNDIIQELHKAIKEIESKYVFHKRALTVDEVALLKNLGIYTKEEVTASAARYSTIRDWRASEEGAYNKALKMGWTDEVTSHMTRLIKKSGHWTKEAVLESARDFSSQTAWKESQGGAWSKAVKMGWVQEACSHMDFMDESKVKSQGYWTKERVLTSAQKYQSKAAWRKEESSAVAIANRNGWIAEATKHMQRSRPNQKANGYWTEERVLEDAKKYDSVTEWRRASMGAYSAAIRKGWIVKVQSQMEAR